MKKQTFKYFFFCLFMLLRLLTYCQDTIFTKSSQSLLVKVLEISKTEVSYKVFYNPDGVIYKIANEQISRIVYENGIEESKFQITQKTTAVPKNYNPEAFVIEGKHLSYHNNDISHNNAFKMMLKRDVQQNSDDLNEALLNAESKKNGQIAFNILAPLCGVGGLYLVRKNYYGPHDAPKAKAFILSGIGLCVTSIVIAQIYKSAKNKHIRKAAALYNNEIL